MTCDQVEDSEEQPDTENSHFNQISSQNAHSLVRDEYEFSSVILSQQKTSSILIFKKEEKLHNEYNFPVATII
jgi:hypothetical protein